MSSDKRRLTKTTPPKAGPNPQGINSEKKAYIDKSYSEKEVLSMHEFKSGRSFGTSKEDRYYPMPIIGGKEKIKSQKLNNGGMSCPHRPDGIRGYGVAVKGHKFTGVK